MNKITTVSPERYVSPDAKTFIVMPHRIVCASNESPDGFEWEEWDND